VERHFSAFALPVLALVASVSVGCGGSTPEAKPAETAEAEAPHHHSSGGPSMESEVGGLNQEEVKNVFRRQQEKLTHCWDQGRTRIPFLAGQVSFHVKVDHDGKAASVSLSESTLGDLDTEKCLMDVIQAAQFPQPVGGKEGLADYSGLEFPASDEVREPVAWSESDMGGGAKAAHAVLRTCKAQTGGSSLKATLYVNTQGKIQSVGFAGDATPSASDCAADKLKKLKFNSPGSYAAKVSLAE
jgi:hypothetical protein